MNKDTLIQLFKAPYKRQAFIENGLLPTFQGKVSNLKIYDAQGLQPIELTASEQNYAISAVKYGEFQTLDEIPRTVELYEIIVNDNKQIERSRVGLGALVKKHIIGNNAILVNFAYQNPEKRSWRFSFIARDGVFQDGEMQIKDTHPKRYTYVFGEPEETYKTALDRFFVLGNELEITINKIKDAFGVEAMSKAFFDEYRDVHYAGFVDYLMRSNFKKSAFNGNDKDVRDFVKKLLGRIVFLYFLQKKGWLGAKDTSYKNGDKNFMTNFFKKAEANDAFYANWLSKLFYDALNNERPNDDFKMPDGEVVKIPYLNGGLFEKETNKYDFLTLPADLFTNLFEFFDQYNFTIFEDSPEEHTVAVDPEMLGHIFENLLEDNKDKGAFYTPKEIVHYMTQESLIEYLHTQIPDTGRTELENFVKSKDNKLTKEHKKEIDQKLDTVKICDPAIGSGAFPMGLLQEIFGLKERIAYDLGYKVWSPATVKENIIQKSIYGVDIERGAVDIARLRFWLSLIVDEEMPKALPNLDYKIVVGNSLVSKFDDTVIEIDWDRKGSVGEADKHVQGLQTALKSISEKQKHFFESKSNKQKAKLKDEIRDLKLDVLINQLSFNKASYLNKNQKVADMGFGLKPNDHKKNLDIDLQVAEFDQVLAKLNRLIDNPDQPFNHFDWKLDFPEVLNPLVNEARGFDIVIANPPYLKERGNANTFKMVNDSHFGKLWHQGKMDYWFYFLHKSIDNINNKGVINFITSRYWINSTGATKLIKRVKEDINFVDVVDIGKLKVFDNVAGHHMIHLYSKSPKNEFNYKRLSNIITDINATSNTPNIEISICNNDDVFVNSEIVFGNRSSSSAEIFELRTFFDISQGVVEASDKVSSKMFKTINDDAFQVGQGVFVLSESEVNYLNLSSDELQILKPYIDPSEVNRYFINKGKSKFLIYSDGQIKNKISNSDKFKNIRNHLNAFSPFITSSNAPYGLHRARDKKYFENNKILFKSMFKKNEFFYDTSRLYFGMSFSSIINSGGVNLLPNLLAVLNSKFALHWFYKNGKHRGAGVDIGVEKLRTFPLVENFKQQSLKSLSEIMSFVLSSSKLIDEQVPNSHLAETFDEVIDALVFELYFPEEFIEKGIEIEKYANDIFNPIEGLKEDEQIKAIQEAYQSLREKDNPLRNQIKLMKIELKELLLPILSV
jgi:adenine-specific DNA-methyltransferase